MNQMSESPHHLMPSRLRDGWIVDDLPDKPIWMYQSYWLVTKLVGSLSDRDGFRRYSLCDENVLETIDPDLKQRKLKSSGVYTPRRQRTDGKLAVWDGEMKSDSATPAYFLPGLVIPSTLPRSHSRSLNLQLNPSDEPSAPGSY